MIQRHVEEPLEREEPWQTATADRALWAAMVKGFAQILRSELVPFDATIGSDTEATATHENRASTQENKMQGTPPAYA